jgi:hypothetical protein
MLLPIFALLASVSGKAVPLSQPVEEARSASRGMVMLVGIVVSMILSGVVAASWAFGWFWSLIAVEAVVVAGLYLILRRKASRARWLPLE